MYLHHDIYSHTTRKLYGKAGTEVKVISDRGVATIVEDMSGNRFSVPTDSLGNNKAEVMTQAPVPVANKIPAKVQKKKGSVTTTQSLF